MMKSWTLIGCKGVSLRTITQGRARQHDLVVDTVNAKVAGIQGCACTPTYSIGFDPAPHYCLLCLYFDGEIHVTSIYIYICMYICMYIYIYFWFKPCKNHHLRCFSHHINLLGCAVELVHWSIITWSTQHNQLVSWVITYKIIHFLYMNNNAIHSPSKLSSLHPVGNTFWWPPNRVWVF